MDFHSLARKDLQAMCKKNKIPANMTNLAMADALKSLKSIEWDEEVMQKLMPQSDAIEQHGSPLPRSRRVTAINGDITSFSIEVEELKNKEESTDTSKTPCTAVRRSQRVQSAATKKTSTTTGTATGTTRGRKKQEETAVVQTPATRRTTRTAVKTVADTTTDVAVAKSRARSTRQSSRRPAESVTGTRVTKNMVKIMSLDQEEQEDETVVDAVESEKVEKEQEEMEQTETVETEIVPPKEAATTETEVAPLKEVETTETEVAPLKEVETTETEIASLKEVETTETEIAPLNQVETIETEITPPKEAELNESTESVSPSDEKLGSVEQVEEQTGLKEPEEDAQLVSDEKMDSAEEVAEQTDVAELNNDISALPLENSNEEERNELINETPDQKVLAEIEESPVIHSENSNVIINEESIEETIAEEQFEEIIAEEEADQTDLNDSPIMGIVSEPISVEAKASQQFMTADITLDAAASIEISTGEDTQADTTGEICILSPVRPPAASVDKMLDSVVRHFAKTSIHDSRSNVKAKNPEIEAVVSDLSLTVIQDENNKGKEGEKEVDLNAMSLRKLKAIYKGKLVMERRPALAELNDNFLV